MPRGTVKIDPDRLRQARHQRGLTQAELAALAGINRTQYTRYESGARNPHPPTVRAIADVLRVPLKEIIHAA